MTKRKKTSNKTAMKFVGLSKMPTNSSSRLDMRAIETTTGKKGFIVNVPIPTGKDPWETKEIYANSETAALKVLKGKKQ